MIYSAKEFSHYASSTYGDDDSSEGEAEDEDEDDQDVIDGAPHDNEESKQQSRSSNSGSLVKAILKLAPKREDEGSKKTTMVKEESTKVVASEEEELSWTKKVDHEGNSYLVLVNQAGRTIKTGEQIMFFYGRHTNAYLMLNYGFCYRDNKYDQIDIALEMKPASANPSDMLCFDEEREEDI